MASFCKEPNDSDDVFDYLCSLCRSENKNVEAEKFCVDCPDYYSNKCAQTLHSVPALRKHKIIENDSADGVLPSMATSRCDKHGHQVVDMYCKEHDQVGCYTCMIVDHRKCDNIDIPEYVRTKIKEVPDFLQEVKNVESELKVLLNTFKTEQKVLSHNKQAVIDQINAIRLRLEHRIKKAAEDTIQKLEEEYDKLIKDFKNHVKSVGDEIDKMNTTYRDIYSCLANIPQAFVLVKTHKNCLLGAQRISEKMKEIRVDKRLLLSLGTDYETITKKKVSCLGDIIITPYIYSFRHVGRITPPKDSRLHDSCCTPDGSIFLTDWYKRSLIRVCSGNMMIMERLKLPYSPYGVCCISDNAIALSLDGTIKLLSINDRLKLLRTLNINIYGRGLSYIDGVLYVASYNGVCKYNMDGKLLESYHKDNDDNCILSCIWNITVNPLSKHIHITDRDNGVITMDQNGSIVNIVKDNLSSPMGISVDKYGQVFVSDYNFHNIIQLNFDGKYVRTAITDGLSYPTAVCIHTMTGLLYIASEIGRNIDVYKTTF